MFEVSIVLNIGLAIALLLVIQRAKKKILEEKLATFAACLTPLSRALMNEKHELRFKLAASELTSIIGNPAELEDEVHFYLTRAAFIRPFRSACLADVGGEYVRLLALQTAGSDDEDGNQILEYIGTPQTSQDGAVIEPRDFFGEETLVAAQLVAERKLLDQYAKTLAGREIRVFAAN